MMPPSSKDLINQMMKQGGKIDRLPNTLKKLFGRHFDIFHKCNNTSLAFV